jgi:hypothetical protein
MHGHIKAMTETVIPPWANGAPMKSPSFFKKGERAPLLISLSRQKHFIQSVNFHREALEACHYWLH